MSHPGRFKGKSLERNQSEPGKNKLDATVERPKTSKYMTCPCPGNTASTWGFAAPGVTHTEDSHSWFANVFLQIQPY